MLEVIASIIVMAVGSCNLLVHAVDEEGQSLPGVHITLHADVDGRTFPDRFTDATGTYLYRDVPAGQSVAVEGRFPAFVVQAADVICRPPQTTARLVVIEPAHVSLVQVLASPTDFHGRYITVEGVLRVEFEGNALYLDKASRQNRVTKNAIWVDAPPALTEERARLQRGYTSLTGRFNARSFGHGGLFSGSLEDIRTWNHAP
jgi:hypothetical protein